MTTTTETLVRASAEVTRITTLREGDVYKRLETSGGDKLLLGMVTEILHNGEEAAIIAVEYGAEWSGVQVSRKVFSTERGLAIFPMSADEWGAAMGDLVPVAQRKLREAEKALLDARELVAAVEKATTLAATTPEFTDSVPAPAEAVTPSTPDSALDF